MKIIIVILVALAAAARSDDVNRYRLREDVRLSKTLLDRLRTYDAINLDECKKTDDDLRTCLTGVVGEEDTRKLLTDKMDIHLYVETLDKICLRLTDTLTCYKNAMVKKIECAKEHDKVVDEELLTKGMTTMENILTENCLDETKTDMKHASEKLKVFENTECVGVTKCINEKIHGTRFLYGTELIKFPYVDTTKCCTITRYRDCILKEWETCDTKKVDKDLREKAMTGMNRVLTTIGCTDDDHLDNVMDKRFFQLKEIAACRDSVPHDKLATVMPKCTLMRTELQTVIADIKTNIMSDTPTGDWVDRFCTKIELMEECYDEKMVLTKHCLRDDETIFKSDGVKPIKKMLENLCKDNGVELKKLHTGDGATVYKDHSVDINKCLRDYRRHTEEKVGCLSTIHYFDIEVKKDFIDYKKCLMDIYTKADKTDLRDVVKHLFEVVDELKED